MKGMLQNWLAGTVLGLVLPGLLLTVAAGAPTAEGQVQTTQATAAAAPLPVLLRRGEEVTRMDMDDYLTGVVLGEMSAAFEPEALKAQAVAARTYAWKAYCTGGKHGDGSVCDDSRCCQAYLSREAYLQQGGSAMGEAKVRAAVAATSGYVLTFEGQLIEATYFSCSGGQTEAAVAVWGTDYPYLRSVESPGEEKAVHFEDTVTFTPEAFCEALGTKLEGDPEAWFHDVTFTQGGGVESMGIGQQSYTGVQLRACLGLRSTSFSIAVGEAGITVTTHGYGHRVGMSQYGADAMAVTGHSFQEILQHYYPGTEITLAEAE